MNNNDAVEWIFVHCPEARGEYAYGRKNICQPSIRNSPLLSRTAIFQPPAPPAHEPSNNEMSVYPLKCLPPRIQAA
ncbi:hypothetical protein NDS46_17685 [Paenibacillus thiaminolyticus]|uniref:hypothetical protein n=1 Tax=Paenibacillus thiaminolyticus TaxID=49283 RepID=UPI00232F006F|nr:hypothetical protein [Paenibacillus thiaminolyticus]WCF06190.1 hypothetical protein NDS46_17685 [Paenibacillus thiaminolyticus]